MAYLSLSLSRETRPTAMIWLIGIVPFLYHLLLVGPHNSAHHVLGQSTVDHLPGLLNVIREDIPKLIFQREEQCLSHDGKHLSLDSTILDVLVSKFLETGDQKRAIRTQHMEGGDEHFDEIDGMGQKLRRLEEFGRLKIGLNVIPEHRLGLRALFKETEVLNQKISNVRYV
jgi:hypothetical protein